MYRVIPPPRPDDPGGLAYYEAKLCVGDFACVYRLLAIRWLRNEQPKGRWARVRWLARLIKELWT